VQGAGSAFFAIIHDALHTAPLAANILPSITRHFIVKAATNIGLAIKEKCITPAEAAAADELFIAVTTKDIVPIVKFDDKPIGKGVPGRWVKALMTEFLKFTV